MVWWLVGRVFRFAGKWRAYNTSYARSTYWEQDRMNLEKHIEEIRLGIKAGRFVNEAAVSQGIVIRLLDALSWPKYETQIVCPEYSLRGRRVNGAISREIPMIFILVIQSWLVNPDNWLPVGGSVRITASLQLFKLLKWFVRLLIWNMAKIFRSMSAIENAV